MVGKEEDTEVLISYCRESIERFNILLKQDVGRVQWLTPAIPELWETEAGRSRGQELETILVNMVKPRLY